MEFAVLGDVQVVDNGDRPTLGGVKQRTVLALLIAAAGRPVSTDSLIDGVYGDEAPAGARRSIQTYVSNLRGAVGDAIRPEGSGYVFVADRGSVDAFRFEDAVADAAANGENPDEQAALLREALSLWRGHPYANVDAYEGLAAEVTRLNELRLTATEERIDAELAAGRHREMVAELESLTNEHPVRERFRSQQMVALYRSGRQAEALRAYEKARTYLVEEAGLDPSPELRALEQSILEQDPALALEERPAIRRLAILAADVADPFTFEVLGPSERGRVVTAQSRALDDAVAGHGGAVFAHRGSAIYASFGDVESAVAAAAAAQKTLASTGDVMRMAASSGEVQVAVDGILEGPPLTRAARLVAAAHGGQVLLSAEANQTLAESGGAGWIVRALGQHDVDGSGDERPVSQLMVDGLPGDFPPLRTEWLPPPLPMEARGLPGYELREQVGSGVFGVVHRAYQPSVGREVAIKIIRPELANEAVFIRHFEVEAQLVARLEHPHIVPLHDYWRNPDGAYLVMRWLRGGTLADRIVRGSLSLEQADALVAQIGPALSFAHRHGVVHRDLKASNILLDEDGAAYLADFGIARLIPEEGSGSVAGDIRDLARVVGAALGGSTSNEAVRDLLAQAISEEPGAGFADVVSFVDAWNEATGTTATSAEATTFTPTRNPYKGLHAFGELDAEDFYGRQAEVDEVIATLRAHRMVAVVGPSGIGKSSVVRAGMIPALRQGAIAGSEDWLITDMLPGPYPYEELASALIRVASTMPTNLEDELRRDPRGLARSVKRYVPEGQAVLLVVDQFEELFTLSGDDERLSFLAMLAETVADDRANVQIVITMRADYFDRPLRFAELGDALRDGTVPISAPSAEALNAIITQPAANVGVSFEPGLVDRITTAVTDQPGALPLLEYALTELFDQRTTDQLTVAAYESTGGVHGALGRRAETTYRDLDGEAQVAGRQVFLRLVNVAEEGRDTRRRVRLGELERLGFTDMVLRAVLRAFGEYRLLTFDRDPITRSPTVEVAHEAMLTDWARLAGWIADQREDLLLHSRLAAAVADWEQAEHADSYLLTAGRLEQHEAWTADTELTLTSAEQEYLAASRTDEDERAATRRRRRRLVMSGFAAAAVIALVLAVAALLARNDAQEQTRLAQDNETAASASAALARSRELSAAAIANLDRDPELSLLLALEASESAPPTVETTSALRETLANHRAILTYTYPEGRRQSSVVGDLSPDGKLLAVGGIDDGLLQLTEVETGREVWEVDLGTSYAIERPFFIEEGRTVVVSTFFLGEEPPADGQAGLLFLDVADGTVLRRIDVGECGVKRPNYWTYSDDFVYATLPPCGELFAGPPPLDTSTYRIDLATGDTRVITAGEGVPRFLQAAEGERRVLVNPQTLDQPMYVFDPDTGAVVDTGREDIGGEVANISADGRRIVYDVFPENGLEILDLDTGTVMSRYHGHSTPWGAWFSRDGETMYSTGRDGTFQLWDPDTGENLLTIPYGEPILWASVTPDLSRAAVFSADNTAKVFELDTDPDPAVENYWPDDCPSGFIGTEMQQVAGDLAAVAIACSDEELSRNYIFDVLSGPAFDEFIAQDGNGIALSRDGSLVALQPIRDGLSANVAVFDVATGTHVRDMEGLCPKDWYVTPAETCRSYPDIPFPDAPWVLSFNPDGTLLAMAGSITSSLTVWDVATGAVVINDSPGADELREVEFSPDGTALLVGTFTELIVLSTEDWSIVETRRWNEEEGEAPSRGLHYSSDGARIVAAIDGAPTVLVLDATTLETMSTVPETHAGALLGLDVSSDDQLVATVGADGFARVWELDTGALLSEIPIDLANGAGNVAFINDDRQLMVTARRGPVKIVTIDTGDLIALARSRVTRGFTPSECDQYQLDPCPTREQIRER